MISRRSGTCQFFLRRSGALRHRGLGGTLPFREFPFRPNFSRFTHSFFCPFQLRPFPILPNICHAPLLFHPISFSPIFHFAQKPSHPTPISPNDHFALFPQGPFPFCPNAIFSSTGHRPGILCHGPLSIVRPSICSSVCPCVNFFFKHLLLWNYLSDFDEISQKCSHHGPLQNFLK